MKERQRGKVGKRKTLHESTKTEELRERRNKRKDSIRGGQEARGREREKMTEIFNGSKENEEKGETMRRKDDREMMRGNV